MSFVITSLPGSARKNAKKMGVCGYYAITLGYAFDDMRGKLKKGSILMTPMISC